jgi:AmiR/NasT family two-component response regulator
VILARQLSLALTRRAVIDQAIGILRARTGLGAEDALAQPRRPLTGTHNVTLAEVCQRIVDDAIRAAKPSP